MKKMAWLMLLVLLAACGPAAPDSGDASELNVAEFSLTQAPDPESGMLSFAASVDPDPRTLHPEIRAEQFPDKSCPQASGPSLCVALDGDQLMAVEDWADPAAGSVIVTRNGEEIYRVAVGGASPIPALQGLWVYDGHWAVETAVLLDEPLAGEVLTPAQGDVAIDGESLNDKLGYEGSFGFQTLNGKPFYFYRRDGKVNANYDGVDVELGYDEIPHYNCCSASSLNPKANPSLVTFFGRRGDAWSYGEIDVFDGQ